MRPIFYDERFSSAAPLKIESRILFPSLLGNVLELYDLSLYGYFATTFGEQFFPSSDPMTSLIASFAVFALSFLVRPIGSLLFGYYGDRFGRKRAFSLSLILMAFSTGLLACLPTAVEWGIWASMALVFCRILQGLAMAGEFGGSMVYLLEHANPKRRGYYSAIIMSSALLGILLGSFVSNIVAKLSADTAWADQCWRIPFLLGMGLALLGFYTRRRLPETPVHQAMHQEGVVIQNPVSYFFQRYSWKMLSAVGVLAVQCAVFYIITVFLLAYLQTVLSFNTSAALLFNTVTLSLLVLSFPVWGKISDVVGMTTLLQFGAVAFLLSSPFLFILFRTSELSHLWFAVIALTLLVSMTGAVVPHFIFKLYDKRVRYTGLTLTQNLANGFIGGTAPLLATKLVSMTQDIAYLAIIPMVLSIVCLLCLRLFPAELS